MKILMVCPDWFPFSAGLSQSCLEICQQLENNGHEIKILVAKDKDVDAKGMDVIEIPYVIRLIGRNPIVFNYWHKIKSHIKWADKICLFSYMYEMNSRIIIYKSLGLFNKPIIHFYRGSLENEGLDKLELSTQLAKNLWDITFGKIMFTKVNKTISNSKPTLNHIKNKYGVSKNKLTYIPTGIDVDAFIQRKKEHKRVIFIGRLIDNKGIHHFEQIVKQIPKDWKFTIIGDGALLAKVTSLAKNYSQIEIIDKIPHTQVKEYLSKSDILILPTYAEGSPRVVIEASASQVPSIAFNVGDVENTVTEKSGYKIKRFDIDDFCKKLNILIVDKNKRQKMGLEAYKLAKNKFDWKVISSQIEKELEKA